MNSIHFIQPIMDFTFYFLFSIYYWNYQTYFQEIYFIFAISTSTFYLIIVLPYKLSLIPKYTQLARMGMGLSAIVSFIISVLLTFEADYIFITSYWGTLIISALFGIILYKKEKQE